MSDMQDSEEDDPILPEGKVWELRLYVAGKSPKCVTAFTNLKKICEEHLAGQYRIEVIDLLENPRPGPRRPNRGHPDTGAKVARANSQDHR